MVFFMLVANEGHWEGADKIIGAEMRGEKERCGYLPIADMLLVN